MANGTGSDIVEEIWQSILNIGKHLSERKDSNGFYESSIKEQVKTLKRELVEYAEKIAYTESLRILDPFPRIIPQNGNFTRKFLQYHHEKVTEGGREECENPCLDCPLLDFKIYENYKAPVFRRHQHCHCWYMYLKTLKAGQISKDGMNGPDITIRIENRLPDYYITKEEAIKNFGWTKQSKKLSDVANNKTIGGNIYRNSNFLLPVKPGRVYYECDVDYEGGFRNSKRLVYSNDGLMFYCDDHYQGRFYYVE